MELLGRAAMPMIEQLIAVTSCAIVDYCYETSLDDMFSGYWAMFRHLGGIKLYRIAGQLSLDGKPSDENQMIMAGFPTFLMTLTTNVPVDGVCFKTMVCSTFNVCHKLKLIPRFDQGDKEASPGGDITTALLHYVLATMFAADITAAYTNAALVRIKIGTPSQLYQAIDDCTAAIHFSPTVKAFYRRGIALSRSGHPALAVFDFERALAIEPDNEPISAELERAKKASK
jgi:tetratricopeptide (TPR) repeat protein